MLSFSFLATVSLLITGVFLVTLYSSGMDNAKNSLRQCNSQIVTYADGMFHENASILRILAADDKVRMGTAQDYTEIIRIFEDIRSANNNITYVYSGYQNGSLFISDYPTPVEFDAAVRPWYLAAAREESVAQLVYRDAVTDEWLFSQCVQLRDDEGNMVGAVCIDSSNASIVRQLNMRYKYASQRSFIVDRNGIVLIHPEEQNINLSMQDVVGVEMWGEIVTGLESYASYQKDGTRMMAYFERIPRSQFWVATAIDSHEVVDPILRGLALQMLLAAVFCLAMGFLLSGLLLRRFALPIVELGGRIRCLTEGTAVGARDMRFRNAEISDIAENIEVLVRDIANREERRKAAEYLSFHDSMTGLYNRRFFEEELLRLDVKRNWPLCLVCCDINGLKMVNDVFGHAVGDKLIALVARAMEMSCRADDILARIGGDEFAVILPHTSAQDAEQVIRRIQDSFPKENVEGAWVSASLGFASKTEPDQQLEDVLRAADDMMYEKKLLEGEKMRRCTVNSIIAAAEREGLIGALSTREAWLLSRLSQALCPDASAAVQESYRLRQIGLCSLVCAPGREEAATGKHHTETAYRILSSLEEYRSVANYILHYMEHWDGSGWPAGLSGQDIPLPARIIAVVEAACRGAGLREKRGQWYDPEVVDLIDSHGEGSPGS